MRIRILLSTIVLTALCCGFSLPAHSIMLVSRSQEVSIGKQVEASMIKEYGGLSKDKALTERVARVGKQVGQISPRQDITYTYKVVNSEEVNAFAAPGGPIVITQRLAKMLKTDGELAFVLAHETGHIAAQHGRKAINQALIAQNVAALLLRNSGDAMRIGANVMYTLYTRGYSRDQEYEADNYGYQLMTKAGYNAEQGIKALAKLGIKRTSGVDKYLSTHPDIPDRIDRIAKMSNIPDDRKKELIDKAQAEK
ncbi:MAG: M48 family metalloprotease [Armatimonadetes bacterium]|jgi:predicted Zn-dependent protease|nr:M48 family metalloprotease [Armatimonadota bacterium]